MSELRTDVLKDGAGTGSPSFPNGLAKADIANAMNAAGEAPIFGCRAWVNFYGARNVTDTGASTNGQPVLIRASGNVTSVVKNNTGDYTINFTTALEDGNYAVCTFARIAADGNVRVTGKADQTQTGSQCAILVSLSASASTPSDVPNMVAVAIFR